MKTVALLTDFGLDDNFVGVMKGVMLNINPRLNLIDLSHNIRPQDVLQAAFLLKGSFKYFPKGTIFLVVIDPGVGSKREPIVICTRNYSFVGPDNGVLSLAADEDEIKKVVIIENKEYLLSPISDTFHGRDIFAPAAARLSKVKNLGLFGRRLNSILRLEIARPGSSKRTLNGEVIYIDIFGNLITNIDKALFKRFTRGGDFSIRVENTRIDSIVKSYQAVDLGEPLAIFGSFGLLEISVNQGSAQKSFHAKSGLSVNISRRSPEYKKHGRR